MERKNIESAFAYCHKTPREVVWYMCLRGAEIHSSSNYLLGLEGQAVPAITL